ncbi:hypothetical protein [Mycolicibacterium hodleri]|uniref:Uncharacterized protein n=1 Tax=Mycolicibacterium hodleri TaxID=49897 RepID=A0A502EGM4_9MYCO|nr:hypothetical protein [Mycolicibacterium hodleri]TPG35636.1 hypothetical protein EAH80_06005 [Mycolicibacterium hodleri]
MNAVEDRVTDIRMFTIPVNHVGHLAVGAYAAVAAQWERLRLLEHQNSALADEEVFLQLSAALQRLSKDLGLRTCTVNDGARKPPGVSGITDHRGFLPDDLGYLRSGTWHESTGVWCHD